jgi:hypothetical protein
VPIAVSAERFNPYEITGLLFAVKFFIPLGRIPLPGSFQTGSMRNEIAFFSH